MSKVTITITGDVSDANTVAVLVQRMLKHRGFKNVHASDVDDQVLTDCNTDHVNHLTVAEIEIKSVPSRVSRALSYLWPIK